MAVKGKRKRHLTFFLCPVGFLTVLSLFPRGVCCEYGRRVHVFVGLWGRRGRFFLFWGWCRLCGGFLRCFIMRPCFLCLVRWSGMGFRGVTRVLCGFVGLHVHIHGVKFCVEVTRFYFVVCMADFGNDGFIPSSHVDWLRFCEQLFCPVDFPDDPFSHHVCTRPLTCLHASPECRVVAYLMRHFVEEPLVCGSVVSSPSARCMYSPGATPMYCPALRATAAACRYWSEA